MFLKAFHHSVPKKNLTEAERLDWIRLFRTENVGPITFFDLISTYGSAKVAIEKIPSLSIRGGAKKPLKVPSVDTAHQEVEKIRKKGGEIIALVEENYPDILTTLPDAPPLLSVLGNKKCFQQKTLGIVGARNASLNGRRFAESLAKSLGEEGFVIASGFARGIDREAHIGSLKTGTIAVLAGGIDIIYPKENADLYQKILDHDGLIIAEMPFSLIPQARHFPRRNRLISGLSQGVIVIEAALHSGSLITARTAAEQGRDVFSVPGFPLDPRAQGSNRLIKDGAILVQTAQDVLDAYTHKLLLRVEDSSVPYQHAQMPAFSETELDKVRIQVIECLSPTPTPVDEIIRQCQIGGPAILVVLLELELAGRIQRHAGNQVSLVFSQNASA